ncbi:rna-binding post-transcriptional regulator cip2 [Acrodontium crateriforme]|uniref:Rna-binding post-transcriptional regulator cip2 n=1 Tax=Acrodontium crateriforme TaxID=150365 RepID=A0AAQ3M5X0_9PEZI|nr:rna-binding post-transcriptional regulator cip2 [Acrodontium crateriforme]
MNNHNNYDMYFENQPNRSPNSQRRLNRQPSRQFEQPAYGHLPSGLYTADDYQQDANRFGSNGRNATIGGYGGGFDMGGQSWNAGAFLQNNTMNGYAATGMRKPPSRGRTQLPSAWLDQPAPMQMTPFLGGLGGMGGRQDSMHSEPDEELIPTAIVIKNIPFAIKKEQLVAIMTDMGLPLPYAFNYHFDNGVFRGLAFANFTNPEETAAVIDAMNHFELNGRKLRVEYKKMLPAAERERIEREKRERRGQLEEQHRPMATLQTQGSMSSLNSRIPPHSPSPVSARNGGQSAQSFNAPSFGAPDPQAAGVDVDLNDPQALQYYTKLILFKEDPNKDVLVFSPALSPPERRIVHTLAHHMGLGHTSKGESSQRAVHVFKEGSRARVSPPMPQIANLQNDSRRALNRAATTDFSDVRAGDNYYNNGLRHQGSGLLGSYDASRGAGGNNLRAAKSFADLRSYTPSPVPSTSSFSAALANNVTRLQDLGNVQSSGTPTLMTPTSGLAERGETNIINGLGNMNLGGGFGGSPRGLRGFPSWDRENPGPIGSNRSFSTNANFSGSNNANSTASSNEERSQTRNNQGGPERQPRGPLPERGAGFPRSRPNGHTARNSDELSQQSSAPEITVEH